VNLQPRRPWYGVVEIMERAREARERAYGSVKLDSQAQKKEGASVMIQAKVYAEAVSIPGHSRDAVNSSLAQFTLNVQKVLLRGRCCSDRSPQKICEPG
jgi:hypothetical protein